MLIFFSFVQLTLSGVHPTAVQGAPGPWALKVETKAHLFSQAVSAEA